MAIEQRRMVRNAGWILVQRAGLILCGLVFAAVVPRLMGTQSYGRYALLFALATWSVQASELGFNAVMARFLPEVALQGKSLRTGTVFGNLLVLRLFSGTFVAVCFFLVTTAILGDVGHLVLVALGISVLLASLTGTVFSLFLGLNRAARWGMSFFTRRWLMVVLVPAGFSLGGLLGAILGLLLAEILVLAVGSFWARTYLTRSGLVLELRALAPLLRFGLVFFLAALLYDTFRHSGEAIVRIVTGSFDEVAYFGISVSLYAAAEAALQQFFFIFAPFLSLISARGESEQIRLWVERLLRGLTVIVMPVVFGAFLLADDVIPLLLGRAYKPVVLNVVPLALTLLALVPALAAGVLTLVMKRPGISLAAAAVRLAGFWLFSVPLAAVFGSRGACAAILAATAGYAAYFTWRVRRVFPYSLRKWLEAVLLAAPFLLLTLLKSSWMTNLGLFAFSMAGYLTLVLLLNLISPGEVKSTLKIALRPAEPVPDRE